MTRIGSSPPLAFAMLSKMPQGYNKAELARMPGIERSWAAQVAEGNLFPSKPRSAVAVTACRVLDCGKTEFLLIQRGKAPNYGEWSLPGGSIELGEGTLAAGKRELLEETQLCDPEGVLERKSFSRFGGGRRRGG